MDTALMILRVVVAVAALVAPGYLLGRAARIPARLPLAFPLSLVVLFHAVFWVHATGARLGFANVLGAMVLITAAAAYLLHRMAGGPVPSEAVPLGAPAWRPRRIAVAFVAVPCGILLLRSVLEPLSGFDTTFRWDFLSLQILRAGRYDFYPPYTPGDYRWYFYVDGIPPAVSFTYWWLYVAAGRYVAELTAFPVVAQYVCTIAIVWRLATDAAAGRRRAGWIAAIALAACTLFYRSVALAQETGLTALAAVAMLYASGVARHRRSSASVLVAAACAALAALAREYGWAFAGVAAVVLAGPRSASDCAGDAGAADADDRFAARLRRGVLFSAAVLAIAGPWYVRNWAKTGNPFYSLRVPSFPVNPMYDAMIQTFRGVYGASQWTLRDWGVLLLHLLDVSPLQWTLGLVGVLLLVRRRPQMALLVVLIVALWVYSAGITTGGPLYTLKMLTPALAVLSVGAGWLLDRLWDRARLRPAAAVVLVAAAAYAALWAWVYPRKLHEVDPRQWAQAGLRHEPFETMAAAELVGAELRQHVPPTARILSPDALLHRALFPYAYQVVPPWSPEVGFLMDPAVSPAEARRRLAALGITVIAYENQSINTLYLVRDLPCGLYRDPAAWVRLFRIGQVGYYTFPPTTRPAAP